MPSSLLGGSSGVWKKATIENQCEDEPTKKTFCPLKEDELDDSYLTDFIKVFLLFVGEHYLSLDFISDFINPYINSLIQQK